MQIVTFLGSVIRGGFKGFEQVKALPALVVVPNSTITNWVREFERWAPHLRVVPFYGDAKSREVIKNYSFTRNDIMRDEDQQIFRYFMWERSSVDAGPVSTGSEPPVKFFLAYQPPWILSPRDIELFADKRLKCLPSFDPPDGMEQQRYNSAHRVWAKVRTELLLVMTIRLVNVELALGYMQNERLSLVHFDKLQSMGVWRVLERLRGSTSC